MTIDSLASEPEAKNIGNNLIRALKPEDRRRIEDLLEFWPAQTASVLYEPGDIVSFAYFP
jgi:hypothetical protein